VEDISQSLIIEPLKGDVSEEVKLFRLRVILSGEWSAKIIAVKGDEGRINWEGLWKIE